MAQVHKKFTDEQVKDFISRYLRKEIKGKYIQEILGVKKIRFWELVERYEKDPENFSVQYKRTGATRKIPQAIEQNILKELSLEKKLIEKINSVCP